MPGRFERSALLVDTEGHNRVTVLVSCQQESPFRIQSEIPRSSSLGRGMADQTEQTARAVDPVDDDAVVTTVRGIHETPVSRNMYIGARAFPVEILRESGQGLQLPEATVHCVIGQGGQAGIEFVDKISEPAIGPEG